MSALKLRLSQVPSEYHNQMFKNLVDVRGVKGAGDAVLEDITLSQAFPWLLTPEGHCFWETISEGETPSVKSVSKPTRSELEELVEEAERRGFGNGVNTKWGVIRERESSGYPIQEHELCDDGSFYYRNIKVRNKKGKWIKQLSAPVAENNLEAAIHALLSKLRE